jgi:hypothetical protein
MGLKLGSDVNCPFNEFHEVVSCTIDAKRFRDKIHVDSVKHFEHFEPLIASQQCWVYHNLRRFCWLNPKMNPLQGIT